MPKSPRKTNAIGALLLALSVTGCGSDEISAQSAPEDQVTSATVTTETSGASTPVDAGADEPTPSSTPSPTPRGPEPSGLPQPEAGEPLTLSDFFQPDGDWSQNSYSVADQQNVKGIGSEVASCSEDSTDTELELRLENKFEQLSFSVGQSNASDRSDQRLVVRVLGDNEQLDVNRIPFNKIQQFQVDVEDTNAVRIVTHLDGEVDPCDRGSVQVVVHDISVK